MADNLDPEVLRQLNENMDLLSRTVNSMIPGMVNMASSMDSSSKSASSAFGSIGQGASIMNDWNKIAGSSSKLMQAEALARQQSTNALENFNKAGASAINGLTSLTKSMLTVGGGMSKYTGAVEGAAGAVSNVTKNFGPLGIAVGKVVELFGKLVGTVFELNDNLLKSSDSLSKIGITGGMTTRQLQRLGENAGYSAKNLEDYADIIKGLGPDLLALGASTTAGAKSFGELTTFNQETIKSYGRLGITQKELNKNQADYIKLQILSGQQITERSKTDGSLRKASLEYTDNLLELSALTGQNVDDIKKQQEANRANLSTQIAFASKQDEAIKMQELYTKTGNEEYKRKAESIQGEIDRSKQLQDVASSIGMSGKQMDAFNQMIATGNFTKLSAGFAAGVPGILEFIDAVKKGKRSPEELAKFMSDATSKMRKTAGTAIMYNADIAEALGVNSKMMQNDARFRGKSIEQIREMVAKEKAEREKAMKEGTDDIKDAREEQRQTERQAQLALQSMSTIISGPVNSAFTTLMKVMGALAKGVAHFAKWLGGPDLTSMFDTPDEIKEKLNGSQTELDKITKKIQQTREALSDPKQIQETAKQNKDLAEEEFIQKQRAVDKLEQEYKNESDVKKKALIKEQLDIAEKQRVESNKKLSVATADLRSATAVAASPEMQKRMKEQLNQLEKERYVILQKQYEMKEKMNSMEGKSPATAPAEGAGGGRGVATGGGGSNYLKSLAMIESSGNRNAKAETSSAAGMFQFTKGTWEKTVKDMGLNYTLEDRFDPAKAAKVAEHFTQSNRAILEKSLGRAASDTDLYLAHFLGAQGATEFLKALSKNPDSPVSTGMSSKAIEANQSITKDKETGKLKTLQQFYDLISNKVEKAGKQVASGKITEDVKNIGIHGVKTGGLLQGPDSGFLAQLHGTELVIPMPDQMGDVTKTPLIEALNKITPNLLETSKLPEIKPPENTNKELERLSNQLGLKNIGTDIKNLIASAYKPQFNPQDITKPIVKTASESEKTSNNTKKSVDANGQFPESNKPQFNPQDITKPIVKTASESEKTSNNTKKSVDANGQFPESISKLLSNLGNELGLKPPYKVIENLIDSKNQTKSDITSELMSQLTTEFKTKGNESSNNNAAPGEVRVEVKANEVANKLFTQFNKDLKIPKVVEDDSDIKKPDETKLGGVTESINKMIAQMSKTLDFSNLVPIKDNIEIDNDQEIKTSEVASNLFTKLNNELGSVVKPDESLVSPANNFNIPDNLNKLLSKNDFGFSDMLPTRSNEKLTVPMADSAIKPIQDIVAKMVNDAVTKKETIKVPEPAPKIEEQPTDQTTKHLELIASIMDSLTEKVDDVIEALTDGNNVREQLLKYSRA